MRTDGYERHKITDRNTSKKFNFSIDLNDPATFRPQVVEKYATSLWDYAVMRSWMTKRMPPAFSFTKPYHRRYVLLLDRFIYTFKTDVPKNDLREFFELTSNTYIFASDQFPGILYCLEIKRKEDGRTWYLQAESVEDMKSWMDILRKTIQWLNLQLPGVVSLAQLDMSPTTDRPISSLWHNSRELPPQRPPPRTLPPPIPPPASVYPY